MTASDAELVRRLRTPVMFSYNAEQVNAERREAADRLASLSAELADAREQRRKWQEASVADRAALHALSRTQAETGAWRPIEEAPSNDGWISQCLFGKLMPFGWSSWVGQCDNGDIWWLSVTEDGSCWGCDKPTHWMPLPSPPPPGASA